MRKTLRQAKKEGFQRIAVICGAWHVPALEAETPAKQDNDLLKGLPKMKVAATWTPWTYANLSSRSGYGAGMTSPAWYEHLWRSGKGDRAIGWLTHAARLFREQDMDCSSAHIIEASRLATSLAALRERPRPGLPELYEALQTTVCMGDSAPLRLIERQLIVGDKLGTIPETAPTVPLQRDLEQQQKSLRLKPEAARKVLDLDLRQANDLARSHLLHRLRLLEIGWATPGGSRNAKGTFHELWEMQWVPELPIAVIAASRWGNTILEAATAKAVELSGEADLLRLAELVNDILFADLPDAVGHATRMLEEKAATANDVGQLLEAIPPLAAIARYGNVRQTDAGMVARVLEGLIPRASIGCRGLHLAGRRKRRRHACPHHRGAQRNTAPWKRRALGKLAVRPAPDGPARRDGPRAAAGHGRPPAVRRAAPPCGRSRPADEPFPVGGGRARLGLRMDRRVPEPKRAGAAARRRPVGCARQLAGRPERYAFYQHPSHAAPDILGLFRSRAPVSSANAPNEPPGSRCRNRPKPVGMRNARPCPSRCCGACSASRHRHKRMEGVGFRMTLPQRHGMS